MSKKWKSVYLPIFIVVVIVMTGGVYWYINYQKFVSTDDAFVQYDTVTVSPKIMGRIVRLMADEGDTVKKGDLLFELDSTDISAKMAHLQSLLSETDAKEKEATARYALTKQQINVLQVDVEKAQEDLARAKTQFNGGVITKENFDHIVKDFEAAQARLESGKKELDLSAAMQNSALASVEVAKAQILVIKTQLADTRVFAPANGVIAKSWMFEGDVAQPGQSVFSLVESDHSWIQVYLEETKLAHIKIGSNCQYTIDAYPNITFDGKIYFIGPSTESQFSLIPPNNASGNFTKVTQRIPIKISIDSLENNLALKDYSLLAGMSAVVKIFKG